MNDGHKNCQLNKNEIHVDMATFFGCTFIWVSYGLEYCKTMLNEVKQVKKKGENDSYKVEKFLWAYICDQCEGVHLQRSGCVCFLSTLEERVIY